MPALPSFADRAALLEHGVEQDEAENTVDVEQDETQNDCQENDCDDEPGKLGDARGIEVRRVKAREGRGSGKYVCSTRLRRDRVIEEVGIASAGVDLCGKNSYQREA